MRRDGELFAGVEVAGADSACCVVRWAVWCCCSVHRDDASSLPCTKRLRFSVELDDLGA